MLNRTYRHIALLLLCFFSEAPQVFAAGDPITFGPEFTFTRLKLLLTTGAVSQFQYQGDLIQDYKRWVTEFCKTEGCEVTEKYSVRVTFKDGFYFSVSYDQNVLEVSSKPISAAEWKVKAPQVQEVLFGGMKKIGLTPTSWFGSGHVSIDKKAAFGGDVMKLRDFVVDYFNHPGLAEGILEDDPYNARSFAQLSDQQRHAFGVLIEGVDRGEVKTIETFEQLLKEYVFKGAELRKGHALWFHNDRVEVRAVRAQGEAENFALQAELFDRRIKHLEKLRTAGNPVKFIPNVGANHAWQSFSQFYYYATDTGMIWKDAKKLLGSLKYKLFPVALGRSIAFGDRNPCIYFFKKQRADLFTSVGKRELKWETESPGE